MKEKLLFIASRFPYPLIGGDRITNYNILKFLSRHYEVYFVATTHTPLRQEYLDSIKPFCKFLKVFYKSKYQSVLHAFFALFKNEPLQVEYYYFNDIQKYLCNLTQEYHINKVVCSLIRTAKYVDSLPIQTKVINMADSLAHHYQNAIEHSHSLLWKMIYKIEYKRLQNFEAKCVKNFNGSLFFNHKEQKMYENFGNAILAPHGVNPNLFDLTYSDARYQHTICFFGKMDYRPNIEAVLWFSKNVMPLLNQKIQLIILGANPSKEIQKLQSARIHISGYVENPYTILCSCLCVIAPMQSGAGIQNKILESMAIGQIVLTNPLGSNPIYQAKHGTHLLVAHTPEEFAYYIHDITNHQEKYESIKTNAKSLIQTYYTWDRYGEVLLKTLEQTPYKNEPQIQCNNQH